MKPILGIGTNNLLFTRSELNGTWEAVPNSGYVIGITTMKDGTILGIGTNNLLFTRQTLYSPWVEVPNSGAVKGITIMSDGTILGVGTNNLLYTRKTLTSPWEEVPNSGYVIGIATMKDGTILGVGTNNILFTRQTLSSEWKEVPNSGYVIGIAIMEDGTILGVGTNNILFSRQTLSSDWQEVPNSGYVIGITILDTVNLGSFIDHVKLLEKDFEPGERAKLEFTFQNVSQYVAIENLAITDISGSFLDGDISVVEYSVQDNFLEPRQSTKIIVELESSENTPVGEYTVVPKLSWTNRSIANTSEQPVVTQATFNISQR